MTPKQARFFREVYHYNTLSPGPFIVDGPRRCKMAKEMAESGWLTSHGPVGLPVPFGETYRVTQAGIDAHNAALQAEQKGGAA